MPFIPATTRTFIRSLMMSSGAAPSVLPSLPFETFNAEKKRVEFITLLSLPPVVPPALSNLKKLQFHNVLGYEKDLAKYR